MRVVQGCHLGISKIIARIFLGRSEYSVWGLIGVPHTITVFYDIHYTVYTIHMLPCYTLHSTQYAYVLWQNANFFLSLCYHCYCFIVMHVKIWGYV